MQYFLIIFTLFAVINAINVKKPVFCVVAKALQAKQFLEI